MLKKLQPFILIVILLLPTRVVVGDVLVLVHGYMSDASTWMVSGVIPVLTANGWHDAGILAMTPHGVQNILTSRTPQTQDKLVYSVDLPSQAPILLQARQLQVMLNFLAYKYPKETRITLLGHSAGGIVARTMLVTMQPQQQWNINALITIAAPHLGTFRAEQALDATDTPFPFSIISDFFGGTTYHAVKNSHVLLNELARPYPGSLLYWLNLQPHPELRYFSIVHNVVPGPGGDDGVVPGYSQDMNMVWALRGKSTSVGLPSPHNLEMRDGILVLNILSQLQIPAKSLGPDANGVNRRY